MISWFYERDSSFYEGKFLKDLNGKTFRFFFQCLNADLLEVSVSVAEDGGGGCDDGGVKSRSQKNAARFPGFCRNCCIH